MRSALHHPICCGNGDPGRGGDLTEAAQQDRQRGLQSVAGAEERVEGRVEGRGAGTVQGRAPSSGCCGLDRGWREGAH